MSETPSIANIMSKQNAEPNYPSVRVQNNNLSFSSVESNNKLRAEGNGKLLKCLKVINLFNEF